MTIQIIHADTCELTADVFAQFDTLIVDPPYSEHVHENATSIGSDGRGVRDRDLGFAALTPELRQAIAIATASVKRWSLVFTDEESAHLWRDACDATGVEYIRWLPWIRWSQPQLSGDRPPTGAEVVLHFHVQKIGPRGGRSPIAKRWNGPGNLTHYDRRCMRGADKHPTEKPLDLMLDMVSYFSDPGEAVLDLCGGSGTTAQAARLLGRDCACVEADERWVTYAEGRIATPLSGRDYVRALEWADSVELEARSVPEPRAADGSDVKTFERAQRRLADVARVREAIAGSKR